MKRRALLLLLAVCISCKPASKQPANAGAGPTVRATVVTIRTTLEPSKRTYDTSLIIAGDRVRNTAERDAWRLYDTKTRRITFVDDVEKTVRVEPLDAVVKRRRATLSATLPAHFAPVRIERREDTRTIHGATARQSVIEAGAYRRELWIAEHPAIPRGLFAMMHAAEPPTSPLAPMMRDVDAALLDVRGFPLVDRAEVTFGKTRMVIERTVTAIAQKDVPESQVVVPKGYRDLTAK